MIGPGSCVVYLMLMAALAGAVYGTVLFVQGLLLRRRRMWITGLLLVLASIAILVLAALGGIGLSRWEAERQGGQGLGAGEHCPYPVATPCYAGHIL